MKFDDRIPIYYQIKQYFYQQIITQQLQPGDKLPGVRQLAVDLTVNVNTIQRALQELITEGVLFSKRGLGNFVTTDADMIKQLKQRVVSGQVAWYYHQLEKLGLSPASMQQALADYIEEENHDPKS